MGNTKRIFKVAQLGLEGPDLLAFERIISMSQRRERTYQVVDFKSGQSWDILVVKAGDKLGRSLQFAAEADGDAAVLTVGSLDEIVDIDFSCPTPLMPGRLLQVLDQITLSVLHYLPEIVIDDAAQAVDVSNMQVQSHRKHKYKHKALVVDDSAPVRKQLGISLNILGIDVDFAENGDEAFIAIQENNYDICFLDVVMPGISGFDICKSIKRHPATQNIPVVMLTGKDSKIDRVKGAMAGCQGYLTKPLNNLEFQAAIEALL